MNFENAFMDELNKIAARWSPVTEGLGHAAARVPRDGSVEDFIRESLIGKGKKLRELTRVNSWYGPKKKDLVGEAEGRREIHKMYGIPYRELVRSFPNFLPGRRSASKTRRLGS